MSDYISRNEIFSVWRSMPKPASISSLTDAINRTPAADVEPVRHGRWGKKQGGFWEFAACSLCGEKTPIWFLIEAWKDFSIKFRTIFRAEKLILEFKRNRYDFLARKEEQEGTQK